MKNEQSRPAWADDVDSPEWKTILSDPRFVAVLRRMMADVAAEIVAAEETAEAAA